ncbi:MAG: nicotinate-nucleotide--dimethylbenzimidazole phosphoribosyltransferase [Anaerolineae bacterium]|nr:nicotinate-nucleotide--dimethylbenzimidazole phosphoribosyltransferase [Anaerolineae bacterium]
MELPYIPPLDEKAKQLAAERQALLTKPAGALGRLEALSIRLAGMTGDIQWLPEKRVVVVCAGDHGITAQGVSAYPQEVTRQMVLNFLRGGAAVNVLARQMNARVTVVDTGVAGDLPDHHYLIKRKIAYGTRDFSHEPAMTPEQADQSLQIGLDVLHSELPLDILCVGEMGIGNTTVASAMIAVLTGQPVPLLTGRGTGVNDTALRHKIQVIEDALEYHHPIKDNVLQMVGGFEIGAMAGLMIGAASHRLPVVVDGVICTAAALLAVHLVPAVKGYLIASHCSVEPGHQIALDALGLAPLMDLNLRLGEGTGAVLALPMIEAAMRTLQEMATFHDAGVSGPA